LDRPLLSDIQAVVATNRLSYSDHALEMMEERGVVLPEVEEALCSDAAEVIEDYPDDMRGASCLILGWARGSRPIHVHLSYPPHVRIITVYQPSDDLWLDYKTRR
jgi:hypothetical protein